MHDGPFDELHHRLAAILEFGVAPQAEGPLRERTGNYSHFSRGFLGKHRGITPNIPGDFWESTGELFPIFQGIFGKSNNKLLNILIFNKLNIFIFNKLNIRLFNQLNILIVNKSNIFTFWSVPAPSQHYQRKVTLEYSHLQVMLSPFPSPGIVFPREQLRVPAP